MEKKAVVLLSGGLDSTTAAAVARRDGFRLYCLSFNYGQRHLFELQAAARVAAALGAAGHLELKIDLGVIGGSSLTDSRLPVGKDRRPAADEIPLTYVPARNTIFISFAASWAETLGARDIYLGVNALDYSGYPDCRPEYIAAMERVLNLGTRAGVESETPYFRLRAPLLRLRKHEIVALGVSLGVDYRLTHSCYDPAADGSPCGRCDSCRLRREGFRRAGLRDPLPYPD
jgi:7-cyano-7-deazaguanine synthase